MKLLILALALCGSLSATQTGLYDFENNANDTSGNGRHGVAVGTPLYLTFSPKPILGSYSLYGCTDAQYVTIPASVFTAPMKLTGSAVVSFAFRRGDISGSLMFDFPFGGYGRFYIYQTNVSGSPGMSSDISWSIPTTSGAANAAVTTALKVGHYYTFISTWNASGARLFMRDHALTYTAQVATITGRVPSFDASAKSADFAIGRTALAGGFSCPAVIDNFAFYDTELTSDPNTESFYNINLVSYGDSSIQGNGCGDNPMAYRQQINNYSGIVGTQILQIGNGQDYNDGTIMPYGQGSFGGSMDTTLTNITAVLTALSGKSQYSAVSIGPFHGDCISPPDYTVYRTKLDAVVNSINAYSPNVKIFLVSWYKQNVDAGFTLCNRTCSQIFLDCYAAQKAAGKNIYLIDLEAAFPSPTLCDPYHCVAAQEIPMGQYFVNAIEGAYTSTPASTASGSGRLDLRPYLPFRRLPWR